jgi:hypothetical protein
MTRPNRKPAEWRAKEEWACRPPAAGLLYFLAAPTTLMRAATILRPPARAGTVISIQSKIDWGTFLLVFLLGAKLPASC